MVAASFPWIDASPSAPLARGRRREATAGARLRNADEQIQPKASPRPVFCCPSPGVGAKSVCCSKPDQCDLFIFFFSSPLIFFSAWLLHRDSFYLGLRLMGLFCRFAGGILSAVSGFLPSRLRSVFSPQSSDFNFETRFDLLSYGGREGRRAVKPNYPLSLL